MNVGLCPAADGAVRCAPLCRTVPGGGHGRAVRAPEVANALRWGPARPRSATQRRRVAAPPMTDGATHGCAHPTALTAADDGLCDATKGIASPGSRRLYPVARIA